MARKKIYIADNLPIKTINGVSVVGSGDVSVGSTYTHPTNHSPSIITQDTNNRFVTDTEKSTWNSKASSSTVTTSTNGLMSSGDKTKLDGIATSANNYVHPTTTGNKHIPSGGASGNILRWSADGTATWGADTDTIYTHPASHPASIITQDANNRFVTDTEKTTWNGKQNALVSGTTIKTINGTTILGSGNIVISAGSSPFASGTTYRSQSRAFGTNYTNSQSVPIFVMITITASTVSHINVTVGALTFGQSSATSGTDAISFIVPPGQVYKVTRLSGTATLGVWAELY